MRLPETPSTAMTENDSMSAAPNPANGAPSMKTILPMARILAVCVLAAGVCFAAGKKGGKRSAGAKSKSTSAQIAKSKHDYAGLIDSMKRSAEVRRTDSVRAADSLARERIRRVADSARASDSLARIADSVRVADSLAVLRRTWMVQVTDERMEQRWATERMRHRIWVELRRRGRVPVDAALPDTAGLEVLDASVQAAGAAGYLQVALASDSGEVWRARVRFSGKTVEFRASGRVDRAIADLAGRIVSSVSPSSAESTCVADSVALARRVWRVAPVEASMADSQAAKLAGAALDSALRSSPWAASLPRDSGEDLSANAGRILRTWIWRQSDSSWAMRAVVEKPFEGGSDSFVVTAWRPAGLVRRLVPGVFAPPATCAGPSTGIGQAWAWRVSTDSVLRASIPELDRSLSRAFRSRDDRQYLVPPPEATDSVMAAMGVRRLVEVAVSGDSGGWSFRARIRDPRGTIVDSTLLRRGGPRARVFAWAARRLASIGAVADSGIARCRVDSTAREGERWAIAPAFGPSDTVAPLVADRLEDAFKGNASGRLVAMGDTICPEHLCMDSTAAGRGIDRIVRPFAQRSGSSGWTVGARVAQAATDVVTDSVAFSESGDLGKVLARTAPWIWRRFAPRTPCDTCVATDTLEAAIAVFLPDSGTIPDSSRRSFRETVAGILAREGGYQILDFAAIDPFERKSADRAGRTALRCRLGAAFALRTGITPVADGWFLDMSLVDISSGEVVAKFGYKDKDARPGRPLELSAWAARRIMGTEPRMEAPPHAGDIPWAKLLKIGIPAAVGIGSVILHW